MYLTTFLYMVVLKVFILSGIWSLEASEENIDLSRHPLIIWWHGDLFPQIEEEGKNVYELKCKNGLTCYSSKDRNLIRHNVPQTLMMYGSDFRPDDVPLPRRKNQMWALLHEESPQNNYILCQPATLNLFNFSATFKQKSDYPLTTQYIPSIEYLLDRKPVSIEMKNKYRKDGLAAVVYLQSHCDVPSDRDRYVKELMEYIQVDSYGTCLHNKDFDSEELKVMNAMMSEDLYDVLAKYKFHLAFENAICDDYVTEKLYRAFHVGSVPVYKGAKNVKKWAPFSRSLILVDDFKSPKHLASFLNLLDKNEESYARFLDYKKDPELFNKNLRDEIEKRDWSIHDPNVQHFIPGFECYVCEEMHKMKNTDQSSEDFESRTLPPEHLDCPEPVPSIGKLKSLSKKDRFHRWKEDFSQAVIQSHALNDLIRYNESNPEMLWNYVEKRMKKDTYKHTEL